MNNTGRIEFNRDLVERLDNIATERFTVSYVSRFGTAQTYTDNMLGVAAYILPDDQIVSIERA